MNILWVLLALFLLIIGVIFLPLPLPLGLPLIVVALVILLKKSRIAKNIMRFLRQRYSFLDNFLIKLEKNLPRMAASLLKRTRPFSKRKKGAITIKQKENRASVLLKDSKEKL